MQRLMTALLGPIFAKEMIELSRRPRYYVLRVIYAALLLFVACMTYGPFYSLPLSITRMTNLAGTVFRAVMSIEFYSVMLLVPAMVGGAIAGERASGSLDLLRVAGLSDCEILLGKLASRLSTVAFLVLSALPVVILTALWGGVDYESLFLCQLSVAQGMVLSGSLALYFSTSAPSAFGAIIRTYFWLAMWCVGRVFLILSLSSRFSGSVWTHSQILGFEPLVNPCILFSFGLSPFLRQSYPSWLGPHYWIYSALSITVIFVLLLWRAHAQLKRDVDSNAQGRWFTTVRRRGNRSRFVGKSWRVPFCSSNPLVMRAQAAFSYDRGRHLFRAQVVLIAFIAIMTSIDISTGLVLTAREATGFLGIGWCWIAVCIGLVASWSLWGDRKSGFLDMTLATPLETKTIVDGTAIAIFWHLWPSIAFTLGLAVALVWTPNPWAGVALFVTGLLFSTMVAFLGMTCALVAKSFVAAATTTLLMPILFGGILHDYLVSDRYQTDSVESFLAILLPCALLCAWLPVSTWKVGVATSGIYLGFAYLTNSWNQGFAHNQAFADYPSTILFPTNWIGILSWQDDEGVVFQYAGRGTWWQALACYWLAIILTIAWQRWWLIRNFDRLTGRTLAKPDGLPRVK